MLDGMLRDLRWLQESATCGVGRGVFGHGSPRSGEPLFSEVVIEWDEATSESSAESAGC